jgi:hypothetical protein
MVVVLRESGMRVVIFVDDHPPPHVHVFGDGSAKITLVGEDGVPELIWSHGMKRGVQRRAMRMVTEHQEVLRQWWDEFHG